MMQTTLAKSFTLVGRGLHTGSPSKVKLMPGEKSRGITFQRMVADLHEPERLDPSRVKDTDSAIHVEVDGRPVKSVEHLLAALYGMGIDNALVQVWGEEIPALDGSAWPFVQAIAKAGVRLLKEEVRWITLKQPVGVSMGSRYVIAFPAKELEMSTVVDYEHPAIGRQWFPGRILPREFQKHLAKAKTFGWSSRIDDQKAKGLVKGGSHANALIFGLEGLENPALRTFEDEPVRHKTMDLLGALALLGGRLAAHVVAIRPGHVLDVMFVKKLAELGGDEHGK
jgi:UDP-3-O-[3-hydroxymyristoyl] N-acetylglucosamine deacetylase